MRQWPLLWTQIDWTLHHFDDGVSQAPQLQEERRGSERSGTGDGLQQWRRQGWPLSLITVMLMLGLAALTKAISSA